MLFNVYETSYKTCLSIKRILCLVTSWVSFITRWILFVLIEKIIRVT